MTVAEALAMRRLSAGQYAGTIQPGWDIAGAADGGYVLAMLVGAVLAETASADPLTVSAHYLSPGRPGPVQATVQVLRSGRRFRTAQARLVQDERLLLTALATVGQHEDGPAPALLAEGAPPPLPSPEQCVLVEPTDTFPPPFVGRVQVRLHPQDATFFAGTPTGRALMRGWFELPDAEPLSSAVVLLAADAFPPPVFNAALPVSWTPTVELTVHVRARPTSPRLACIFRTRFVSAGFLDIDGELWDEDGSLVALSRQLALVPRG